MPVIIQCDRIQTRARTLWNQRAIPLRVHKFELKLLSDLIFPFPRNSSLRRV